MRIITDRDLKDHGDEILRQAEAGQQFTIMVEDRPVAVLGPCQKRQWIPKAEFLKILYAHVPDPTFFEDVRELDGLEDLRDPWER